MTEGLDDSNGELKSSAGVPLESRDAILHQIQSVIRNFFPERSDEIFDEHFFIRVPIFLAF